MPEISDTDYNHFRKLIREKMGIDFSDEQKTLLCTRISALMIKYKTDTCHDFYNLVLGYKEVLGEFINVITTNHTFFYRENAHFHYLQDHIFPEAKAELFAGKRKNFKIWVAASSSGEEVYTIAMFMMEFFAMSMNQFDISILGTDISRNVIHKAELGVYRKENVEKLPPEFVKRYFEPTVANDLLIIKPDIRKFVMFRVLNLVRDSFPFKGKFDVIFVRNVLIYFKEPVRKKLLSQLKDLLNDGGYLFIGHTESFGTKIAGLTQVSPSVYRKEKSGER